MTDSSLQHWLEWKRTCALDLCSEGTKAVLLEFAVSRFRLMARRCARKTNLGLSGLVADIDPLRAWHLFETHMAVRVTKRGKRYKNWLFARAATGPDSPMPAVEGGATLIMRDVVREHLRREHSPSGVVSLQQPIEIANGSTVPLGDLVPGSSHPADEAARREYEELAGQRAEELFSDLTDRERLVLLARRLGVSLAHRGLVAMAGCGHATLYAAYRSLVNWLGCRMKTEYPDDGNDAVMALTLMVLEGMKDRAFSWAKLEKGLSRFFNMIGEQ